MRLPRWIAALALVLCVGSCSSPPPLGPNGFLTGNWFNGNTVEWMTLKLNSAGGIVTGTAEDDWIANATSVRGTVTGMYGGGGFTLYFTFPKGNGRWFGDQVTFTGHLVNWNETDALQGPWTKTAPDSGQGTMIFVRAPAGDP